MLDNFFLIFTNVNYAMKATKLFRSKLKKMHIKTVAIYVVVFRATLFYNYDNNYYCYIVDSCCQCKVKRST